MKKLLALLLCNCLLVPLASGQQGYVQQRGDKSGDRAGERVGDRIGDRIGDKLGQLGDQLRKRPGNNPGPGTNQLIDRDVIPEQPSISKREAHDKALEAFPGRVLDVRRQGDQWRVRMDKGGTVFNVFVDSESGAVMRRSE